LNTTLYDEGEGLIHVVEDQSIPPFPNIPSDSGADSCFSKPAENELQQVGQGGSAKAGNVLVEETPHIPGPGAADQKVIGVFVGGAYGAQVAKVDTLC
jgi:hypothetical protein